MFRVSTTDKCYLLQSQPVLLKETRTLNTRRNMLLQKNKAALIPVVPARYSVICHSQAEQGDREVAVLYFLTT